MKTMTRIMAFAAICLVWASCTKEGLTEHSRDIRFGAQAPVSSITKTVYSYHQETVSSTLWERIDWDNGDLIRIISDQVSSSPKYFDYDISLSENVSIKSFATADPHGADHGLQWGSGTHTFFSMYPSQATAGAQSGIGLALTGGSTATATADLPADQSASLRTVTLEDSSTASYYGNMKLAYMTAATQAAEGTENVTLSFKPMVTTFFINVVNTTGSTMTLRRVELTSSSTALSGKYQVAMDSNNQRPGAYQYWDGDSWEDSISSTGHNSIYADFSGGVSIPATGGNSITVALFALPQNISNLTLTVTSDETGPISLPLKYNDAFITFAGEKKHNINNINVPSVSYSLDVSPVEITYDYLGAYSPDEQEFTVTGYKTIGPSTIDIPWETQVWVDDDNDDVQDDDEWYSLSSLTSDPGYAWLSGFPTTSSASVLTPDPDDLTYTRTYHKSVGAQDVTSHEDMLKAGVVYDVDGVTPVTHNSTATAIDLSYYDFVNRKMDTKRYTANTYIISAPGYYKIPLVYGNGIENGARMADSYSGRAARLGHLDEFICPYPNRNGTESSIHLSSTRPWLNARRSASPRVHWEKYSFWNGSSITTEGKRHNQSELTVTSPVDNMSITTGTGNERYIVFEVTEENIRPGNFLMSSLDQYDNVQWSWQVWITDQDMTPVTINNGTRTYSIMPVNLGWTDLSKGLHYEPREVVLRFASTEKAGLYSAHTLTVKQAEKNLESTTGWGTYYQWGRKDPLTDGIAKGSNNDGYLHESIKHPSDMFYDKSSYWGERYYDWTINNYSNLWESKNTEYDHTSGDLPNHKTVYDPSPRRYCVPPDEVFDGFTSYESASAEGIYFPTGVGTHTVFFPAAGFMNYTSATTSMGGDNGYWTYHPGDGVQQRASYCLNYTYNNSTGVATIHLKTLKNHENDWMSRAYGLSLRPIIYDESAVVSTSDGTLSTIFNFEEMTAQGHGLATGTNLDGVSTTYPSSVESAYQNDFYLSFVSERDIADKQIRYVYDSTDEYYYLQLPDSYDGLLQDHFNRFTIGTTNPDIHIVQIVMAVAQRGVGITTDSTTFDATEGAWVDSAATYDSTTHQWTGGKQSVTFTMDSGTGNPWKIIAISVNYYVDSTP